MLPRPVLRVSGIKDPPFPSPVKQWIPQLFAPCASALLSLVFSFSATSVAVADEWTGTDRGYLRSIDVSTQGMLQVLEGIDDFWDDGTFGWYIRNIYESCEDSASGLSSIVSYLNSSSSGSLLWYLNALLQKESSTNLVHVSVTNSVPPYDDVWLKKYFVGNETGENVSSPYFKFLNGNFGTSVPQQSLRQFLSFAIGGNYDMAATSFDDAFAHGSSSASGTSIGNNFRVWNVWHAEALRRGLALLTDLRDITSNSVSQVSPEYPHEISVTNSVAVTLDADYSPSLPEDSLTNRTGEVVAESWSPPSSDPLDVTHMELDTSGGIRELTLWRNCWLEVGGRRYDIPEGLIDFGQPEFRTPLRVFSGICKTCWWLLYYLALALLLRREYIYYTSLGHTEGAA